MTILITWFVTVLLSCQTHSDLYQPTVPPGSDERTPQVQSQLDERWQEGVDESKSVHAVHTDAAGRPRYTNRLVLESSPYLRQHAHNPVDWYPWSEAAFQRAKAENKPIFLSVGYSTCHWCHVMERESFEDIEIARFLNEHFVSIKVDRESRPDIDATYMQAVTIMTGRGGWPMTVMLTPDGQPFFGGSYFPARDGDRGAQDGFLTVLNKIHERWTEKPQDLLTNAQNLSKHLEQRSKPAPPGDVPTLADIDRTASMFHDHWDRTHGGFGRPPKFPRPSELRLMFQHHTRTGDSDSRLAFLSTVDAWLSGGIRDHLAGGFHRYSVDNQWNVPHFEKMLYDQAQISWALLDAYALTQDRVYAEAARETLDFVLREMRSPKGAFISAYDADSPGPNGDPVEGLFYTWTPEEVRRAVGSDTEAALAWYGISDDGPLDGRSVLTRRRTAGQLATQLGRPIPEIDAALPRIRRAMYQHRKQRTSPVQDDKIILAWNGLMIGALARASFDLEEPHYAEAARRAGDFARQHMKDNAGTVFRTYRDGEPGAVAVLDDYAFYAWGCLALFEATAETKWLEIARVMSDEMDTHLRREQGGWSHISSARDPRLPPRAPSHDGAEPSGNSIGIDINLRLHALLDSPIHLRRAEAALQAFGPRISRKGQTAPWMLSTAADYLNETKQVVLIPGEGHAAMRSAISKTPGAPRVVVPLPSGMSHVVAARIPWVGGKTAIDGRATAYVCERGLCEAPTTEPAVLAEQLRRSTPRHQEPIPSSAD